MAVRFRAAAILLACLGASAARADDTAAAAHGRLADLAFLRDAYVMKSRAFTPEARSAALAHVAALEARAESMTDADFLIAVLKTAALADNGHDAAWPGDGAWSPALRAPLRFVWLEDGLYVARASEPHRDLLGARVIDLDGHTEAELYERLRMLAGGPENYRRWNVAHYAESAELLRALALADSPDRYSLHVALRDGSEATRVVDMVPKGDAPAGAKPSRLLASLPYSGVTPLYLQDPDRLFRIVDLPELGAAYVQFRSHYGSQEEPIEKFVRDGRARLAGMKREHLIVDLRFDIGGSIDATVDFFRELPALAPGRIYVIVSRMTFSAGILAAAYLEQAAGERALIVGEPVGDRLRFWSEGAPVCLPASDYCLRVTDGLWDLVDGCAQEPGCYGDAFRVKVPDLDPDLAAPLTGSAWLAGNDPAMTAIESHLWSCKSCR